MKAIVLLVLIGISALCQGQEGNKNFIDQNYIEVNGKAEMEIIPNQIFMRVILSEKDTKNKVSVQDLEKQMMKKLQEIGLDVNNDVSVMDVNSVYKSDFMGQKEIILSKQFQVIVKDSKKANQVIAGLESIEISNVSIIRLYHDKMEQYLMEIKINAIKAARAKAEAMTAAIGQNIGKALFIQELDNYVGGPRMKQDMSANSLSVMSSINESGVDFQRIRISYTVLCRFELK